LTIAISTPRILTQSEQTRPALLPQHFRQSRRGFDLRAFATGALILVYPVWNGGFPAILKGLFDRVFFARRASRSAVTLVGAQPQHWLRRAEGDGSAGKWIACGDVFDRDLLVALAAMAVEGFDQRRVGAQPSH
jgi:Flavodoxin-like fold